MTLTFEQYGEHAWEMYTPQSDVPEQGEKGDADKIEAACEEGKCSG